MISIIQNRVKKQKTKNKIKYQKIEKTKIFLENPKTWNKKETKPKSNLNISNKKLNIKYFISKSKKNGEKCTGSGLTNHSVAKKRRIARHGGSSSEYWKPGSHVNNIPCYKQRLQCSSNPRRTSHQNWRWLQKANRKPHQLVLSLLLLRGDLVGVIAVVVVSSSGVCLGFFL